MTRWALIEGGVVANVIEQDSAPEIDGTWVACEGAGPGWLYDGNQFTEPVAVRAWDAFDFYRRFTSAERIGIRALALTDPIADDFLQTLNNTIASGSRVLSNDADLLLGLQYLQTVPEGAPILSPARAAALIQD